MKFSKEMNEFMTHAGTVLIMEQDEPKFVVSGFADYMRLIRQAAGQKNLENVLMSKPEEKNELPKSPYFSEPVQRKTMEQDINAELEALSGEGFFTPLSEEPAMAPVYGQQFYRELE